MIRRGVCLALVAVACRGAPRAAVVTSPPAVASATAATPSGTPSEPVWRLVAGPLQVGAFGDVGALDGGDAIVLSGGAILRWREEGATAVCADARAEGNGLPALAVQADGDRFVVLGGDEAQPVVWRSDDRGAHCVMTRVPSLAIRDTPRGTLGHALHGSTVFVWSTSGAIVRSVDGGARWQRLASQPNVVDMAAFAHGTAVAAVSLAPRMEHAPARLLTLSDAGTWTPLDGAEHLRVPVSLQPLADDGLAVAHGAGVLALSAARAPVARRDEPVSRHGMYAPHILVPAGEGRFFGTTPAALRVTRVEGTEVRAPLAGTSNVRAIDASRDGWLWLSDGVGLWRGRVDAPFVDVSHLPLGAQRPRVLAAHGGTVLVAGTGPAAAVYETARGAWRRMAMPDTGATLAAAVDAQGALYVLGALGLAVSDAGEFATVPTPTFDPVAGFESTRLAIGEGGWLRLGPSVHFSNTHGASWRCTFGDPADAPPIDITRHGMARVYGIVASSVRGARVMVLDAASTLWRSEDSGQSFVRLATLPQAEEPVYFRRAAPTLLAWDGADRVAVLHRGELVMSDHGGRDATVDEIPFAPVWADYVDDTLVAAGGALPSVFAAPSPDDAATVFRAHTPAGWQGAVTFAGSQGVLLTRDGDTLWALDARFALHRASLRALARTLVGR